VGHASRSSDLLQVEANLVRVSQSDMKTSGDVTVDDTRGIITKVTSETN
jgi:hypothetical protein